MRELPITLLLCAKQQKPIAFARRTRAHALFPQRLHGIKPGGFSPTFGAGRMSTASASGTKSLEKRDIFHGILSAATAFGKTVVCCNLIARRKVNTLILLESSSLVEQWEKALSTFLILDAELPE